jgi:hypothetical protein
VEIIGLFDPPNEDKLSEIYPEGTPFMLYEVEHEGIRSTAFGDSHQASVMVGAADRKDNPKQYRVFGRLAEQTKQVAHGDLPALVTIKKEGRALTWAPVGTSEDVPF